MAKHSIGIDIGAQEIRAVALAKRGRRMTLVAVDRFETAHKLALHAQLADSHTWLSSFITKCPGAEVVVSLPSAVHLTRIVEFPNAAGRSALAELVAFEVAHEFPLRGETPASGFVVLRSSPKSRSVLAAGAQRQAVEQIAAWVRAAGGRLRLVTVGTAARLALLTSDTSSDFKEQSALSKDGVEVIVELNRNPMEILVISNESLAVRRAVYFKEGSDKQNAMEQAVCHARSAWQAHRAATHVSGLSSVRLISGGVANEEALSRFGSEFGVSARSLDPWAGILIPEAVQGIVGNDRGEFACATGLALLAFESGNSLNLASKADLARPEGVVRRAAFRLAAPVAVATSLLLAALYNPISPFRITRTLEDRYALARTKSSVAPNDTLTVASHARPAAVALRGLVEETQRDSLLGPEILLLLSERLPKAVVISEFVIEKGQSVSLRGAAPDSPTLAETLAATRSIPLFLDARLTSANAAREGGETRIQFEIVAALEPSRAVATRTASR